MHYSVDELEAVVETPYLETLLQKRLIVKRFIVKRLCYVQRSTRSEYSGCLLMYCATTGQITSTFT